jgi:hypothetical protein
MPLKDETLHFRTLSRSNDGRKITICYSLFREVQKYHVIFSWNFRIIRNSSMKLFYNHFIYVQQRSITKTPVTKKYVQIVRYILCLRNQNETRTGCLTAFGFFFICYDNFFEFTAINFKRSSVYDNFLIYI